MSSFRQLKVANIFLLSLPCLSVRRNN
jgi:hypothetical protein